MALVVEAIDCCLLDGSVHPFDLSVGPGMVRLRQTVPDVVCLADHVEAHLAGPGGVAVTRLVGELIALVGQDGVDAVSGGLSAGVRGTPMLSGDVPIQCDCRQGSADSRSP
ncbi:Hypothetical protein GbCGDNIH8_8715 [Granulibacter bethesdensis]|nr:Hypothetical protein GbCGDNIH8_8715 [Granulibacter bethesdensis]